MTRSRHFTAKRCLGTALLLVACTASHAESMVDSIRAGWSTYIFVSTTMPRHELVSLAREAARSEATLVLRGFAAPTDGTAAVGMPAVQQLIADIDRECCGSRPVAWMVDPKLYDRYRVKAVPAFALAMGTGDNPSDYSVVSGDMALGNALKFFAKESALPPVRAQAARVYAKTYGGQP